MDLSTSSIISKLKEMIRLCKTTCSDKEIEPLREELVNKLCSKAEAPQDKLNDNLKTLKEASVAVSEYFWLNVVDKLDKGEHRNNAAHEVGKAIEFSLLCQLASENVFPEIRRILIDELYYLICKLIRYPNIMTYLKINNIFTYNRLEPGSNLILLWFICLGDKFGEDTSKRDVVNSMTAELKGRFAKVRGYNQGGDEA